MTKTLMISTLARTLHLSFSRIRFAPPETPIEQEETYRSPEAQQERFIFKVFATYPIFEEEFEVARHTTAVPENRI